MYDTPGQAVLAFMHLVRYQGSQRALMETPPSIPDLAPPDRAKAERIIAAALAEDRAILTEPEASLIKQYRALLKTENVTLNFSDDAIDALADLSAEINSSVENIGARRLHTVMERLLEEISFSATDRPGTTITIDAAYVKERVAPLAKNADLSRFIL